MRKNLIFKTATGLSDRIEDFDQNRKFLCALDLGSAKGHMEYYLRENVIFYLIWFTKVYKRF